MAKPASRQQLKDYCLRRLGSPVIDINIDDEQVEDRIDDALTYYQEYHFDGTERILYKHIVTATDKINGYISIPANIIGIVNILPIGAANSGSGSFFNIRYQMHLNDLYNVSNASYITYYMAQQYISNVEEMFVGLKTLRFNRHVEKLHIDMDWVEDIDTGQYIIIECYRIVDPDIYTDVWGDKWLLRYTTALIKRQWGSNLSKFEGMQLPGGLTFNGQKLYDDAVQEIEKLEEEMISSYSLPVMDMLN